MKSGIKRPAMGLLVVLFLLGVGSTPVETTDDLPAPAVGATEVKTAFEWIHNLAGEWKGHFEWTGSKSGHGDIGIEFFPTGFGSAMIETHLSGPRASMSSVYHMDGSRLMMTHFCVQNQPRLVATAVDIKRRSIRFDFVDVTDLAPGEGHVNLVELILADDIQIKLRYHVVQDGKRSIEHIMLTRVSTGGT